MSRISNLAGVLQNATQVGICDDPVKQICYPCTCIINKLTEPMIVATATDSFITPKYYQNDPELLQLLYGRQVANLDLCYQKSYGFNYGEDYGFGITGVLPKGYPSVGNDEKTLKGKMQELGNIFAGDDTSGVAKDLISQFLSKKTSIVYFEDPRLNNKAMKHENIEAFIEYSLSQPNGKTRDGGKDGIHQVLKKSNWDLASISTIDNLGVPAFNLGKKLLLRTGIRTEDMSNGLFVMINGVQHVVIVATDYHYDQCKKEYYIKLKFFFYDVFGLDTEDVEVYGADGWYDSDARQGITAWWQLQHQYGYAPLITKIAIEKEFTIPAM